jgi:hypothetical protein
MNRSMMWILPAAALTMGHVGSLHMQLTGEGMPFPQSYTVIAADESEQPIEFKATHES